MHWCEWFKNRSCKGCFVKEANRLSHPSARPAFKQTMFGTLNALSCCSTSCHFWRQVPHFTTETAVWQHAGYGAKPNAGNMKQYNIKNQYLKQRQCRSIPNNSLPTCIYQINSMISVYIDTFKKNKFIYIYIYMGMALKTVWIVPRWSGRLERGGYVKGHDPEVSKARIEDHVFIIWHHMSTWVCGLTRGHMERWRDLFQLDQV